ncbi:hypothetical protein ISN44_As12g017190 [Arabidopsis suecica]|uniref:Uncharacterized protein n=1 Tax=Arabidopsis suecica TaxID=45249 RepID=A0A8T1YK94_ARASU|nr:hypothetical protein ISN44_As12g017190 [Arabidopsis suecica]
MISDTEIQILSLMESASSDAGEVLSSLSGYLRPFSDLLTCREEDRALAVGSITKQFIPFIIKSVCFLHKRLSVVTHESPRDLFRAYDFCLECCELVSYDPLAVQLQRIGLIHCYQTWGWFTHAYNDGFRVLDHLKGPAYDDGFRFLEQLRGPESKGVPFLPDPKFGGAKLARIHLMVVASIVRSVAKSRDMDDLHYLRGTSLLHGLKPWLRYLDANEHQKFFKLLLSDMGECALSVIREAERFNESFVHSFCISTLEKYSVSPLPKCHLYKFSREVLSLLFLSKEAKTSLTVGLVMSVLRTVACENQVEPKENWSELLDLVTYCAHKSQLTGDVVWCAGVAKQLSEIAAVFSEAIPQANVILRIYSAGLSVSVVDLKFRENGKESLGLRALLGDKDIWESLVSLFGMTNQYAGEKTTSSGRKKNTKVQTKHKAAIEYTLPNLDALKFLCQPLASLINFEYKKMLPEREFACYTGHLSVIQDMFLQFSYGFRFLQRWTPDKERLGTDFHKTLLNVAMAAFIISMRTQRKVEITNRLVEDVIASPWISPPELKYLSASFHDIGVDFYKIKHLKMASMAFKICIRTMWTCVRLLCQIYVNKSDLSEDCLPEEAIVDFVSEACSKSAFYLDVLQQHGAQEINKLLVFILENWSAAEDLIKKLSDPTPIIKQWAKIQRIHHETQDLAGSCTPLDSLLSSLRKKVHLASTSAGTFAFLGMYVHKGVGTIGEGAEDAGEMKHWYTVEIVCVSVLAGYAINYFIGKRENDNLALAWASKFCVKHSVFEKNFSLLGVVEGEDSPLLLKEATNVFKFYASGRRYCHGLLATMELKSRHDLISRLINSVWPCKDEISFEVCMNDEAMDHIVFAMARKKAVKTMHKELRDLQRFGGRDGANSWREEVGIGGFSCDV